MTSRRQFMVVFAGLVGLGLAGCASTGMVHTWRDPEYAGGPMKKVLILGVAGSDTNRRVFEDRFRGELSKLGVEGISSYSVLPGNQLDEEAIKSKVRELGVDGLVVSRVIDKKTVETIYPPTTTYMGGSPYWPSYYGGYYGYYSAAYSVYTDPGYVMTTDYVYVETNLYDARTGKLAWTGISETAMEPGRSDELIDGVVRVLIGEIHKGKASKKK
jgi:hypothetical protein